jgi:HAMP domain-containing protein
MNISHQQPPTIIFEDLGPVKLKRRRFFPPLPSLPPFKNPLIGIPIAQRLVLGFLIPALIASLAASIIGIQSAQLLNQESDFYQNLFQSYSSLTAGNDFLQLMNFKLNATLTDAQVPNPSRDQLSTDQKAVQGLETRYATLLQDYVQHALLIHEPSLAALFDGAGHPGQGAQQSLLASSTVRTWQLYRSAQDQILQEIQNGLYQNAQTLEQSQGQLTYSDALSALRQLIQFDGRLTTYVQDATTIQQTSGLITTLIAVILVLSAIGIIGWLIYGTLVGRLRQLRRVAHAVQRGQIDTRITIDGRDEITDVSTSVNTMLDTIVGLLEQTRVQRDALISAAERLFSDMRLANGGEFDVKTAVNNDPIWMLGHAFNFTIGRFRRFVMRHQTAIEQLDVVSQQGIDNANAFLTNTRKFLPNPAISPPSSLISRGNVMRKGDSGALLQGSIASGNTDIVNQVIGIRDQLQQFARQNVEPLGAGLLDLLEQASRLCQQVIAEQLSSNALPDRNTIEGMRSLETLIGHLGMAVQIFQKSTAKGLAEVYSNINQLSITARSASTENIADTSTGLTPAQARELARLTEGFAREVTGLAQTLRRITEEMRSSLAPFRLETPQSSQQVNPISEMGVRHQQPNPVTEPGWRSTRQPNPVTEPGWRSTHRPDVTSERGSQKGHYGSSF